MHKIYIIGNDSSYINWMNGKQVYDMKEADFVVGIGGSDISPNYYRQPNSGKLYCCPETDDFEFEKYLNAINLGKKIVGICKGAQWGSVLAGGALYQHVEHPFAHAIETYDGLNLTTNSLHHNLVDLRPLEKDIHYNLLAWSNKLSPVHIDGWNKNQDCEKEPEVVHYPINKFLGFQCHPEIMMANPKYQDTMTWYQNILSRFLYNTL